VYQSAVERGEFIESPTTVIYTKCSSEDLFVDIIAITSVE
jgi:hypothetical protein